MKWLRQSTSFTLPIGPFLSSSDGVTPQTGLTIAQADVRLAKGVAGAAFAQKANASSATHAENGFYSCPFDASDADTLGPLKIAVNKSGAAPWDDTWTVVPATVYDAFVGAAGDVYEVMINLVDDNANTADRYSVLFFKNGSPITSGITSPTLSVVAAATGSALINAQALTQIATTGRYRYDASGAERVASGAAYYATVTATIDGAARTMHTNVTIGRDS